MGGKLLCLMTAVALLCSSGAASGHEVVRLTDNQLDVVTAGASLDQVPPVSSFLVNGANAAGGVNQFSPSIATLIPTVTNLNLCIFCVTSTPSK
jgi:hypothetical protein